jgi:hypothetical protein
VVQNVPKNQPAINYATQISAGTNKRSRCTGRLILEILLHGYYRKIRKKSKCTASIGLTPAVLIGPTSQRIVEEYIKESYPNQEHLESYRAKQKSKILGMVVTGKPLISDSMVEEYRKHIEHKRYLLDSGTKEFRRPWRENPWRKSSLTTPTSKIT